MLINDNTVNEKYLLRPVWSLETTKNFNGKRNLLLLGILGLLPQLTCGLIPRYFKF